MKLRDWFRKVRAGVQVRDAEGNPFPPFDLLDREFCLDETELKVVGFQYGGKFLRVPFIVRCRVIDTQEVVLVDPDFIRGSATDITRYPVTCEAFRKPYVPRGEEVCRVIGWLSHTSTKDGLPVKSNLIRFADQEQGEGGAKS